MISAVNNRIAARIALIGPPNSGKTTLFNKLTGCRQKTANYPGVTIEQKSGILRTAVNIELIDLPGIYSLNANSPDAAITRNLVLSKEQLISLDGIICVNDANNLNQHLLLLLELRELGVPLILVLNMVDIAQKRGLKINIEILSQILGIPVVTTVALHRKGIQELVNHISLLCSNLAKNHNSAAEQDFSQVTNIKTLSSIGNIRAHHLEIEQLLQQVVISGGTPSRLTRNLDRVLLHPVAGPIILIVMLFVVFQAIFSWSTIPMCWISDGIFILRQLINNYMVEGLLKSLLVDGLIAGMGNVLIFLPQILILFLFILLLEDSGYMTRVAFLMDRIMRVAGLNGRAFIPLLSSFACAVPGIMAARTIANPLDRLITILITPLMTCSARLPVYVLLIAAFIPNHPLWGCNIISIQGLVMFALYAVGILGAVVVAIILRITLLKGGRQPLLMELPNYKIPRVSNILFGLWERTKVFIHQIGTLILGLMVLLWFLSTFPYAPASAKEPAVYYSFAGMIGRIIEPILVPVGFNWQIAIALVLSLAAREVATAALGTVYALSSKGLIVTETLSVTLTHNWSLATALSLLAWYVFAPQCLATIAVVRRETNSWGWAMFMFFYLILLAYCAAFMTYHLALLIL